MPSSQKRRIIDAHLHLYDHEANRHDFLDTVDQTFVALVGDYSALPRKYLFAHYLEEAATLQIDGIVWNEFLSSDPLREVRWAQAMTDRIPVPMSIVGLVDFLNPDLEARLEAYARCPNVTAVREHLGWDDDHPLRRMSKRPDLLTDPQWRKGLGLLRNYDFKCSLEIFATQLPELLSVAQLYPEIGFTIAVMGWPQAVDNSSFTRWKQYLTALSACDNARIVISAIECVFGMKWSVPQAQPWVDTVFELFGTKRIMFGSHRPISGLSRTFAAVYAGYEEMTVGLPESEQDAVFRRNAAEWFRVPGATD